MNTIHSCNVIQVEGSHPFTCIRLHECNVFTCFKCIATIWHREVKNYLIGTLIVIMCDLQIQFFFVLVPKTIASTKKG